MKCGDKTEENPPDAQGGPISTRHAMAPEDCAREAVDALLRLPETTELVECFYQIDSAEVRKRLIDLAEALAED